MSAELWARDTSGVNRKFRELWAQDGTGVNRKHKELWAPDGAGVNRKIFSGAIEWTANINYDTSPTNYEGTFPSNVGNNASNTMFVEYATATFESYRWGTANGIYTFNSPFVLKTGQTISLYAYALHGSFNEGHYSVWLNDDSDAVLSFWLGGNETAANSATAVYTAPSDITISKIKVALYNSLYYSNDGKTYMNVTVNADKSFLLNNSGTSG